jgi:superfamily II DNA or RNA helicase
MPEREAQACNHIHETFSLGVIYVYSIPDDAHKGRLKIGSTTVNSAEPTLKQIYSAAHDRIKPQTQTADLSYKLEHVELAVTNTGEYFGDQKVHDVLIRSGFPRKPINTKNPHSEWFQIDLEKAKNAIKAVKEGREALTTAERISEEAKPFPFRPNQREAIDRTTKAIKKKRKHFLWNAKMRFGKTSAAMQVAKENEMQKVLIVTHRPSVSVDWYDDFKKVFVGTKYEYSSKTLGENISTLVEGNKPFVYFASLQDLRLSKRVVEDESAGSQSRGFNKNDEVFDTTWDMLIVDEAHEGTQSNLGDATFSKIPTNFTLQLSGTPFNILYKHEEQDIYTWDYVMEQEAKLHWDERNPGVPNPYAELPKLSFFTYDIDTFANLIGDFGANFKDSLDGAFKFHEFFRVHKDEEGNDTTEFVHEEMVKKFLDLLVDESVHTKFPYANEQYRSYNKHSLWLLPNRVKVIEAMENLLKEHPVFGAGSFGIVNISGNSRDDEGDKDAKDRVTKAIEKNDYTITLTGQRLTTGASIKEWTAVFMMSDTSSATTYLQAAFRCQTPANIDGKIKTQAYVFDFAPDRTLRLIAEAIELNHKSGKTNSPEQKQAMEMFLNFCPILAAKGGSMKPYDVDAMLGKLKEAIIERVSRNGFDDPKLYNDELLKLDEVDIGKFNELKAIIGSSTAEKTNEIKVNELGLDGPLEKAAEDAERKKKQKKELTEEEKELLKKLQEARKQKKSAESILRAVSIRMPMLVYGADVSVREDITLEKFIELVDDESWEEFMPQGLTKEQFRDFTKYYDEDVFKGVAYSIRAKAYDCDDLLPTERIQAIAEIFSTFKNPDKETVLTPWNIVNMHLTLAFGGHNFSSGETDKTGKPVWVSKDVDTSVWEQEDTKILEINAKSGLYPLLAAYNVYSRKLKKMHKKSEDEVCPKLWNEVLKNNIYVLCKSPMAKSITQRTLAGYNKGVGSNIVYIEDLVKKLQQKEEHEGYELKNELLKKFNFDKDMKFTAVVGNPPYQETIDGRGDQPPIYHLFLEEAYKISKLATMIHPARFLFNAGLTPKDWNKKMLHDKHLKVLYFEQKSAKVFPNTDIKGGVAITIRDASQDFGEIRVFTSFPELNSILQKVEAKKEPTLDSIITGRGIYRLTEIALREHPEIESIQSKGHKTDVGSGSLKILKNVVFFEKKPTDGKKYVQVVGLLGNRREFFWINKEYLSKPKNFDKYKILVPKANGTGAIGEILSTPLIGEPLIGYTETFIGIGAFDTEAEAKAALKYIKSKFARTMLGILKITQDNPRDKWTKVPLQDFTNKSDIDWSESIADIDKQLYKKYGLDQKEIDFIETHVKPMS